MTTVARVYRIAEAILSVVVMFLFKEGSRNGYNQSRQEHRFSKNVRNLLGIRLVHGDAFEDILRMIDTDELQGLKAAMVNSLIRSGVLTPEKGLGRFVVAMDGTGLHSIAQNHPDKTQSLTKTSKGGITSYSLGVLEFKLVTSTGLCISLGSEEIANLPGHATISEKQDWLN